MPMDPPNLGAIQQLDSDRQGANGLVVESSGELDIVGEELGDAVLDLACNHRDININSRVPAMLLSLHTATRNLVLT
jgi:hypothetical protein